VVDELELGKPIRKQRQMVYSKVVRKLNEEEIVTLLEFL
jgi:hypothetical protein